MGALFWQVLQMSMTASVVIVTVLLFRLVLRRAPRIFSYMLWAAVLFRLLCPVSVTSAVSLFRLAELSQNGLQRETDTELNHPGWAGAQLSPAQPGQQDIQQIDDGTENYALHVPEALSPARNFERGGEISAPAGRQGAIFFAAGVIWLCGVLGMLLYGAVSSLRFHRTLSGAVRDERRGGISVCRTHLSTAFVYGIFRPCIYLPESLLPSEEEYILLHEQIHVRRGDQIWRMLGFAALAIHWYNPLVWVAFAVSGRDMEMSCDEAVIRRLGRGRVKEYSDSLLALATGQHVLRGAPLAFGEGDTGSRIRNVLRYRKPAVIVTMAAALVFGAATVILVTNPAETTVTDLANTAENGQNLTENDHNPTENGQDPAENRTSVSSFHALEEKYAGVDPEILRGWRTLERDTDIFRAEDDGIYRTVNGKTERIFEGYVSLLPNMTVYDRRLFFLVDSDSTSREDFEFYDDIRWVDLDAPNVTGLVGAKDMKAYLEFYRDHMEEEEGMVNFHINEGGGEGYIEVWDNLWEGAHQMLLPVSSKDGYKRMNWDVMNEEERQTYGKRLGDWLLANPGVACNVSIRTGEETYAWLDLDGDSSVERISLKQNDSEDYVENLLDYYVLTVADQRYEGFGITVTNNLLAMSPDGEKIFLALYEYGPSADPVTTFFCYADGQLREAGTMQSDIRQCRRDADGTIWVWERADHVQTDMAEFPYGLTEDNRLERLEEDSYKLLGKNPYSEDIKLTAELPLYGEPEGTFKVNLKPGTVFFERVRFIDDSTFWVYVEGGSGAGWMKVENREIADLGQNPVDVFENLSFYD